MIAQEIVFEINYYCSDKSYLRAEINFWHTLFCIKQLQRVT